MRGRGGHRGSWWCRQGVRRLELRQRRRGVGSGDGTQWRPGSGVDKRESVRGGVVRGRVRIWCLL
jgi:hypothetical protein